MKRVSFRLIVVLLIVWVAGVALNVAIAWGVAVYGSGEGGDGIWGWNVLRGWEVSGVTAPSHPGWWWDTTWHWGMTRVDAHKSRPPRTEAERLEMESYYEWTKSVRPPGWVELGDPATTPDNQCEVSTYAYGWPLRAMHCEWRHGYLAPIGSYQLRDGIALEPDDPYTPRALPTGIIWTGLVVNPLIFAAMIGAGMWGFTQLRRRRRRAHGLCARCAYPVGEGQACSECGAPHSGQRVDASPDPARE